MSAPQSVQEMVLRSNQLGGQGSTQHPKFNASFYMSKCFVTPFWIGQYQDENAVCLWASLKQLKLTFRHGKTLFLTPPLCCGGHQCRILKEKGYLS